MITVLNLKTINLKDPHKDRTRKSSFLVQIGWVLHKDPKLFCTRKRHKDRTRTARGLGHAVVHAIHLDRGIHKECTMHAQGTHKDTHKDFETSARVVISGATDLRPSHITQDHAQGNGTRTHAQGPHKVAKSLHKDPHKENCTSTFLDISLCSMIFLATTQ